MPRSTVPAFLRDPVQRSDLAAELHTMADDLEQGDERPADRLTAARVNRLRSWAVEVEGYGR